MNIDVQMNLSSSGDTSLKHFWNSSMEGLSELVGEPPCPTPANLIMLNHTLFLFLLINPKGTISNLTTHLLTNRGSERLLGASKTQKGSGLSTKDIQENLLLLYSPEPAPFSPALRNSKPLNTYLAPALC